MAFTLPEGPLVGPAVGDWDTGFSDGAVLGLKVTGLADGGELG